MTKEQISQRAAEVYPDLPAAQAAFIAGMEEMEHLTKPHPDMVLVDKQQLKEWLAKIKEGKQFKAEAETDIGWVATSLYNIQKMDLSLPKLMKLLSGGLKPEAIGLDLVKIEAIAAKYAPVTAARLKAENEASTNKKK